MDVFEAARTGSLDELRICLFWDPRVDRRTGDGRTALRIAAEHGQTEAVNLLLERNADPNAGPPDGAGPPLTAAIENEHWETAAALVRAGADPNASGMASLVIAAPPKRRLLALMLKHGLDPHGGHAQWGPYIHFALNDAACFDLFLAAGFDLARCERDTGESLLERALSNGIDRFRHLLALGADANLPVDRTAGRTMLMTVAAEDDGGGGTHDLIRLLVQRGADLDHNDAAGHTALHHARRRKDRLMVALLTHLAKQKANEIRARRAAAKQTAKAKKAAASKRAAKPKPTKIVAKPKPATRSKQASAATRPAPAKKSPERRRSTPVKMHAR